MSLTVAPHPRAVSSPLRPSDVIGPGWLGYGMNTGGDASGDCPVLLDADKSARSSMSDGADWFDITGGAARHADFVPRLIIVPGGAASLNYRADAVTSLDYVEAQRRASCSFTSEESLTRLDALLSLPLDVPVNRTDVSQRTLDLVGRTRCGAVDDLGGHLIRRLRVPLTVHAVLVRRGRWSSALKAARSFGPFAQRIVVTSRTPTSMQLWEAQMSGVGVWVERAASDGSAQVETVLTPAPFVASQFKAVGWRFAEHTYRMWAEGDRTA